MKLQASEALHARARAIVRAFEAGEPMPEPFDALASDLARFQAAWVPGYGRLCSARGIDPAALRRAADAPAVPSEVFRLTRVFAFDDAEAAATFRTSGTTAGARGAHSMRTLETYDLASVAFARRTLLHGFPRRIPVLVLGPRPEEQPDSSLGHMIARFVAELGEPAPPESTWFLSDGVFELSRLDERVARLLVEGRDDVLVLATSFALVHLLDALGEETFRLPRRTRIMQTGGFKGRSRVVEPADLLRSVSRCFGVDERAVVSEYGMTELSSQFYEAISVDPEAARGVHVEPPWARVVPVDPETLLPVPDGEIGLARIEDLMNVDSAFAILTADRARRIGPDRFELLGRVEGSPARGCSLAIEEIMESGTA